MFKTLANAWKIPELRKKILFTIFIVVIFRIGANIPVPFISIPATGLIDASSGTTFLNYLSMMTGDAFNYGTIFALSITPYINSSIIIQLLTVAIPALERLSKEGEEGRKKIATITRYVTIGLGILQSVAYFIYLNAKSYVLYTGDSTFAKIFQAVVIITVLTAGTALVMWLGEQINDKGIGNGISIILFAGIVSRIPTEMSSLFSTNPQVGSYFSRGGVYYFLAPFVLVCYVLMVAYIVWMDNAERRIPVQYAKRVVGRKMYGGQSSNLPLKLNMSGVMPIIFASSIVSLPTTIGMFVKPKSGSFWDKFLDVFATDSIVYVLLFIVLIIAFAYFYIEISFNNVEVANNLKKNGGFIPGIRPGKPTADYIKMVLNRITLIGAIFLAFIAGLPLLVNIFASGYLGALAFGGSSLLIVVGVALETARELESQMAMRHYKGFLE